MQDQLKARLRELRAELEAGHKVLAELEQRHVAMEQKLLRIGGAIQVLEEELGKAEDPEAQPFQRLHEPVEHVPDNGLTSTSLGSDA